MQDGLIAQMEVLREEIEKERDKNLFRLLKNLKFVIDNEDGEETSGSESEDDNDDKKEGDLAVVALLCMIINIECQLIQSGYKEYRKPMKKDITDLMNLVQSLEYDWRLSNYVISDALDLLCTICEGYETILKKNSDHYIPERKREKREVTPEMYFLFTGVAKFYANTNRVEQEYRVLDGLCTYSRKRNNVNAHKELVARVFGIIGDDAPEFVCRIAGMDSHKFEDDFTAYAGDFYWFYGCCLQKLQKFKEAGTYFEKCYRVRKYLYGESSWYTAIAQREKAAIDYTFFNIEQAGKYLLEFIENIENNVYEDINDNTLLDISMAKTIYVLLLGQFDEIQNPELYVKYMENFLSLCLRYQEAEEPLLSLRLAWNLKGNYYKQCGDFIQAESAIVNALLSDVLDETKEILSDVKLKSNLLLIYYVQNDIKKAIPLMGELWDMIQNAQSDVLPEQDKLRVYMLLLSIYINAMVEMDSDEWLPVKEYLGEICERIIASDQSIAEYSMDTAMFIIMAVFYILQYEIADRNEQKLYWKVLQYIDRNVIAFKLTKLQKSTLYFSESLLAYNLGLRETEKYFQKYLDSIHDNNIPVITKASMYKTAGIFYEKNGKYDLGISYVDMALEELTEAWHSNVRYSNDTRLLQSLVPAQVQFCSCYALLRKHLGIASVYERLLQFKALASLAGRERNRIIHETSVDQELIKKINYLQNQLAGMETANIFLENSAESNKIEEELRELEKEFAVEFPTDVTFVNITLDSVMNAMPEDSVVLEYFLSAEDYGGTQFSDHMQNDNDGIIDIYVMSKTNGKILLNRHTVTQASDNINKAQSFIQLLQDMSCNDVSSVSEEDLEGLRWELYSSLIQPIVKYIGERSDIYIAPDADLINLPFELLYGEERLTDEHQIIKIECARDFLFTSTDTPAPKGSMIMGNPQYEVRERELISESIERNDFTRDVNVDFTDLEQLPFAELEARRIASYFGSIPLIGLSATKQRILEADGYENIHIATHGLFDLEGNTDSLYSSCLFFAGATNWMKTMTSMERFGNGILTADEISRLNLKSVKLVVLSSCLNGMSDACMGKGFQGMVGAFAAAGVDYVIAHLWNAADSISTVILMDTFYYYYVEEKKLPPAALNRAKDYLRTLSIDKMRKQGWFAYVQSSNLDVEIKNDIALLEECDGRIRPFKNEIYWGGFSCYRCN